MQRLTILCVLLITLLSWVAIRQPPLQARQAEPADGQSAESNAATDEQPASSPSVTQPVVPDPETAAAAATLLRDARDRLYAYRSVRAKLVERATIGNRRFLGEGEYLAGPFPQLRLEYRVRVGNSEGTLIEVCDGKILRTSKEIRSVDSSGREPAVTQWTRKDVTQILEASQDRNTPDAAVLQAELGLGGLPTLLASLERTMVFDAIRELDYKGDATIVIQGQWRPEYVEKYARQMGPSAQSILPFLPERVRVYFDRETLFPTRILYLKRVSQDPVSDRPMLALEFSEIRLNEGVDAQAFRYVPPKGVDEIDETGIYLRLIESIRASAEQPGQPAAPATQATEPADSQTPGEPATKAP